MLNIIRRTSVLVEPRFGKAEAVDPCCCCCCLDIFCEVSDMVAVGALAAPLARDGPRTDPERLCCCRFGNLEALRGDGAAGEGLDKLLPLLLLLSLCTDERPVDIMLLPLLPSGRDGLGVDVQSELMLPPLVAVLGERLLLF